MTSSPTEDTPTPDNINPRKEYRLEHFVMSKVHAPADTPVIFVDHGLRLKGEQFISLAKLSDLEALVRTAQLQLVSELEQQGCSQHPPTPTAQGHEADNRSETADGCPCLLVEPCSYACSCACPVMSGGCMRCAKHGSMEQRIAAAKRLAQVTDLIATDLGQDKG